MTQHQKLTDQSALAQRRARAQESAMFLHDAAADELKDRMALVNKPFSSGVVISGFPDFWARALPMAQHVDEAETLALEAGEHDLVIHSLSLHWANDPVGQIIQCRRALKPDGLMLAACFGGQTLHELRACLSDAEVEITGGLSPRVAPMADIRDMGGLLQRAGLALPVADKDTLTVSYRDIWHLMHDLRAMGEANALSLRLRHPTRRAIFERAGEIYARTFADKDERITATFELLYLAGWAPDANQPQPLRPGSAQQRLSDALGATETKLPN